MVRKVMICVAALAACCAGGWTGNVFAQSPGSAMESLVEAERAFASLSRVAGMDSAFAAFLAPQARVLRPSPVAARQWYQEHSGGRIDLAWRPSFACVSAAGDMGFTSGPSRYRDLGDPRQPAGYGDFASVWKRGKDGQWQVVFDHGIDHQASTMDTDDRVEELPVSPWHAGDSAMALSSLMAASAFAANLADPFENRRYVERFHPQARVLRPGRLPMDPPTEAERGAGMVRRMTMYGEVSASRDLGYTVGMYELTYADNPPVKGYYATFWSVDGQGQWKIVLDIQGRPLGFQ